VKIFNEQGKQVGEVTWDGGKDEPAKATGEREVDDCITCVNTKCQMPNRFKHLATQCRCAGYKPPVAQAGKDAGPTSCRGCDHWSNHNYTGKVSPCFGCGGDGDQFKNYTPHPPKGEDASVLELTIPPKEEVFAFIRDLAEKAKTPKGEDAPVLTAAMALNLWLDVYEYCKELGMIADNRIGATGNIIAFIRDLHRRSDQYDQGLKQATTLLVLCAKHAEVPPTWEPLQTLCGVLLQLKNLIAGMHRRAGEGYSVEEITRWIETLPLAAYAMQHINDPQDGIKAVTKRKDG
jgi:hypothetical protein